MMRLGINLLEHCKKAMNKPIVFVGLDDNTKKFTPFELSA